MGPFFTWLAGQAHRADAVGQIANRLPKLKKLRTNSSKLSVVLNDANFYGNSVRVVMKTAHREWRELRRQEIYKASRPPSRVTYKYYDEVSELTPEALEVLFERVKGARG